ncbi:D-galactarate dehydratase [Nioella nitratireducens]|uniref:D-galactarate dehydratase n=1 Tax=Nioella nitratireducens TaxID=1287720 RepID=UPI0011BAC060|nr:D-galactarate dehydratase [Nioella nitratireducens]
MTRYSRLALGLCLLAALSACGNGNGFRPLSFLSPDRAPSAVPPPPDASGGATADEAADIPADEAAMPTPPAAGPLGTTVATLGDPARPGMWLETPLVAVETQGTITANGQTLTVTLYPSGGLPGSGSRISLAAMQALGLPLTSLPELSVSAGG